MYRIIGVEESIFIEKFFGSSFPLNGTHRNNLKNQVIQLSNYESVIQEISNIMNDLSKYIYYRKSNLNQAHSLTDVSN